MWRRAPEERRGTAEELSETSVASGLACEINHREGVLQVIEDHRRRTGSHLGDITETSQVTQLHWAAAVAGSHARTYACTSAAWMEISQISAPLHAYRSGTFSSARNTRRNGVADRDSTLYSYFFVLWARESKMASFGARVCAWLVSICVYIH